MGTPQDIPLDGNLRPLQRGAVFAVQFGISDPEDFDFGGRSVEFVLDSPNLKHRTTVYDGDDGFTVDEGGASFTISKGESWSAALPEDGTYSLTVKVDGDTLGFYNLKVWSMPAGPTDPEESA